MQKKNEEKEEIVYIDRTISFSDWSKLLLNRACPECGTVITISMGGKWACTECNIIFKPGEMKPQESKPEATKSDREKAMESFNMGVHRPLELYYFCSKCYTNDMKRLSRKNEYETEMEIKLSVPNGEEGYTKSIVRNPTMTPIHETLTHASNIIPFNCGCGTRRYVILEFFERDRADHPIFTCPLGFHSKCMNCKHAFDQNVGRIVFSFRCDLNLRCVYIKEHKDKFSVINEELGKMEEELAERETKHYESLLDPPGVADVEELNERTEKMRKERYDSY